MLSTTIKTTNTKMTTKLSSSTPTIRKLQIKDVKKASKTLFEAFENDSLSKYLVSHISDPIQRSKFQILIYECYLIQHINCGLVFGQNETTDQFETVSIWSTPQSESLGLDSFINLMDSGYGNLYNLFDLKTKQKVFKGMLPLLHNSCERIINTDSRFKNKDLFTLVYVGSTKSSQGKGNLRKLFQFMNENYIDLKNNNSITYLESSSPSNIPIYEKFGFKLVENIILGDLNGKDGKDFAIMNVMIRGSNGNDWTKDKNTLENKL